MKRVQSYSSISLYKKCPLAWKHTYVDGHRSPPSPASKRGSDMHSALEEFFKGGSYPTGIKALAPWRRFMEHLTTLKPTPEAALAVDENWQPVAFDSPDAYLRGAADLMYEVDGTRHILDWKSGRVYPDHPEQGVTYVALDTTGAHRYETEFVYLDMPTTTIRNQYSMHDRVAKMAELDTIITTISNDTEYVATPSQTSCQWCALSWRKGGECRKAP